MKQGTYVTVVRCEKCGAIEQVIGRAMPPCVECRRAPEQLVAVDNVIYLPPPEPGQPAMRPIGGYVEQSVRGRSS